MANDAMKDVYVQGLQALHTAGQQGSQAAASILEAASAPELKQELQQGSQLAQRQAERLQQLMQAAGAPAQGTQNEISEGIIAASKRIMQSARDPQTRDAGIIASGQIALHYHIAAYGTLAGHAKALGMMDAARMLHEMVEETKRQDERYTQLAERMVNQQAAAA